MAWKGRKVSVNVGHHHINIRECFVRIEGCPTNYCKPPLTTVQWTRRGTKHFQDRIASLEFWVRSKSSRWKGRRIRVASVLGLLPSSRQRISFKGKRVEHICTLLQPSLPHSLSLRVWMWTYYIQFPQSESESESTSVRMYKRTNYAYGQPESKPRRPRPGPINKN